MRSFFYTRFIVLATVFAWLFILPQVGQAQTTAHHVLVANGGQFGPTNFVTVGTWSLISNQYSLFDSIAASSVQDLVVVGDKGFMAADSFVVKYQLSPNSRLATVELSGVRKIGIKRTPTEETVVVTRGFGATGDFVKAYDLGTMNEIWSVSGISGNCEGIAIVGDTAYVGVPGSFSDSTGSIAVIDMNDGTLVREDELGIDAQGIGRVYAWGGSIWTVNSLAFGSTTGVVTQYEIATQAITHHPVAGNLTGGAGFRNDLLYVFINGAMGTFDPTTGMVSNSSLVAGSWVGSSVDTTNQNIFLTQTDFFSFGRLHRYNAAGGVIDSVDVGISPEAIALVTFDLLPISAPNGDIANIITWPNPAHEVVNVDASELSKGLDRIVLRDLMGRKVLETQPNSPIFSLDVSQVSAGTYLLEVSANGNTAVEKIIIRSGK